MREFKAHYSAAIIQRHIAEHDEIHLLGNEIKMLLTDSKYLLQNKIHFYKLKLY